MVVHGVSRENSLALIVHHCFLYSRTLFRGIRGPFQRRGDPAQRAASCRGPVHGAPLAPAPASLPALGCPRWQRAGRLFSDTPALGLVNNSALTRASKHTLAAYRCRQLRWPLLCSGPGEWHAATRRVSCPCWQPWWRWAVCCKRRVPSVTWRYSLQGANQADSIINGAT